MARFHFWFLLFLLSFIIPAFLKSCGGVSVNVISRTNSLFLNFYFRSIRQVSHLPVSFVQSASLFHLSLIILLAGDISINPGPDCVESIKLAFTNIRSLSKNHVLLSHYVDVNNVDMVCLSETWLSGTESESHINELTPRGFSLHHRPRIGKKGGGVGFFTRNEIHCSVLKSPEYSSFEHLVLNCKFQQCSVNFVSIYRPPAATKMFSDEFVNFFGFSAFSIV